MAFADYPEQQGAIALLQRSLARGRLGHAYLFTGPDLDQLELMARTLAKVLNCDRRTGGGTPSPDCCDACPTCQKINHSTHPDVFWVRPESKTRIITVDAMRDLMGTLNLKPTQAQFKVGMIVAADRLHTSAANSFLKTLEEPPASCVLILLSTEPQRLLETILSRCLRLSFGADAGRFEGDKLPVWLTEFSETAVGEHGSLLSRYRLLSVLLKRLAELKEAIGQTLTERSPLRQYDDLDPALEEKWEKELDAAIEAEYRRQRAETLAALQWWLRDVWLQSLPQNPGQRSFPHLSSATQAIAARISPLEAMENLRVLEQTQRFLATNAQEALTLEVGLLRLKL